MTEQLEDKKFKRRRRKGHHSSLHTESEEGWAVSYSDMLMVLMSFFIIFYNVNDSEPSSFTHLLTDLRADAANKEIDPATGKELKREKAEAKKLLQGFSKKKNEKKSGFGEGPGGRGVSSVNSLTAINEEMGDDKNLESIKFTQIKPKKVKNGKWAKVLKSTNSENDYKGGILIDFPNDLYKSGHYKLNKMATLQVRRILRTINPYKKMLNVVFIGHSDSVPLKSTRKVVDSNTILSTLRAAKAVEYAIDFGFDPVWVSSQGVSQLTRNTRSLSIRVMER